MAETTMKTDPAKTLRDKPRTKVTELCIAEVVHLTNVNHCPWCGEKWPLGHRIDTCPSCARPVDAALYNNICPVCTVDWHKNACCHMTIPVKDLHEEEFKPALLETIRRLDLRKHYYV